MCHCAAKADLTPELAEVLLHSRDLPRLPLLILREPTPHPSASSTPPPPLPTGLNSPPPRAAESEECCNLRPFSRRTLAPFPSPPPAQISRPPPPSPVKQFFPTPKIRVLMYLETPPLVAVANISPLLYCLLPKFLPRWQSWAT